MKKCSFCNSDLPDSAAFCPYCTHSQFEKKTVRSLKTWKRLFVTILLLVLVAAAAFYAYWSTRPITVEGYGKVIYQNGRNYYHLYVAKGDDENFPWPPVTKLTDAVPPNERYAFPLCLLVFQENAYDKDLVNAFMDQVLYMDVKATPVSGGEAMQPSLPCYDEGFPQAAAVCHLIYDSNDGLNQIQWEIQMKNGDLILINHEAESTELDVRDYHFTEYPMNSDAELQALLDRITNEVPRETVVNLYLPAVTYHESLILSNRAINLFGSYHADAQTTFTKTVWVQSREPSVPCITNICFEGDGGTGIESTVGFRLDKCILRNWDTAVYLSDGGSIGFDNCEFADNRIGVLWDTKHYGYFTDGMCENRFSGNDIAIWIKSIPGQIPIGFPNSVFEENGINIQNDCNYPLNLSDVRFE